MGIFFQRFLLALAICCIAGNLSAAATAPIGGKPTDWKEGDWPGNAPATKSPGMQSEYSFSWAEYAKYLTSFAKKSDPFVSDFDGVTGPGRTRIMKEAPTLMPKGPSAADLAKQEKEKKETEARYQDERKRADLEAAARHAQLEEENKLAKKGELKARQAEQRAANQLGNVVEAVKAAGPVDPNLQKALDDAQKSTAITFAHGTSAMSDFISNIILGRIPEIWNEHNRKYSGSLKGTSEDLNAILTAHQNIAHNLKNLFPLADLLKVKTPSQNQLKDKRKALIVHLDALESDLDLQGGTAEEKVYFYPLHTVMQRIRAAITDFLPLSLSQEELLTLAERYGFVLPYHIQDQSNKIEGIEAIEKTIIDPIKALSKNAPPSSHEENELRNYIDAFERGILQRDEEILENISRKIQLNFENITKKRKKGEDLNDLEALLEKLTGQEKSNFDIALRAFVRTSSGTINNDTVRTLPNIPDDFKKTLFGRILREDPATVQPQIDKLAKIAGILQHFFPKQWGELGSKILFKQTVSLKKSFVMLEATHPEIPEKTRYLESMSKKISTQSRGYRDNLDKLGFKTARILAENKVSLSKASFKDILIRKKAEIDQDLAELKQKFLMKITIQEGFEKKRRDAMMSMISYGWRPGSKTSNLEKTILNVGSVFFGSEGGEEPPKTIEGILYRALKDGRYNEMRTLIINFFAASLEATTLDSAQNVDTFFRHVQLYAMLLQATTQDLFQKNSPLDALKTLVGADFLTNFFGELRVKMSSITDVGEKLKRLHTLRGEYETTYASFTKNLDAFVKIVNNVTLVSAKEDEEEFARPLLQKIDLIHKTAEDLAINSPKNGEIFLSPLSTVEYKEIFKAKNYQDLVNSLKTVNLVALQLSIEPHEEAILGKVGYADVTKAAKLLKKAADSHWISWQTLAEYSAEFSTFKGDLHNDAGDEELNFLEVSLAAPLPVGPRGAMGGPPQVGPPPKLPPKLPPGLPPRGTGTAPSTNQFGGYKEATLTLELKDQNYTPKEEEIYIASPKDILAFPLRKNYYDALLAKKQRLEDGFKTFQKTNQDPEKEAEKKRVADEKQRIETQWATDNKDALKTLNTRLEAVWKTEATKGMDPVKVAALDPLELKELITRLEQTTYESFRATSGPILENSLEAIKGKSIEDKQSNLSHRIILAISMNLRDKILRVFSLKTQSEIKDNPYLEKLRRLLWKDILYTRMNHKGEFAFFNLSSFYKKFDFKKDSFFSAFNALSDDIQLKFVNKAIELISRVDDSGTGVDFWAELDKTIDDVFGPFFTKFANTNREMDQNAQKLNDASKRNGGLDAKKRADKEEKGRLDRELLKQRDILKTLSKDPASNLGGSREQERVTLETEIAANKASLKKTTDEMAQNEVDAEAIKTLLQNLRDVAARLKAERNQHILEFHKMIPPKKIEQYLEETKTTKAADEANTNPFTTAQKALEKAVPKLEGDQLGDAIKILQAQLEALQERKTAFDKS